MPGGPVSAVGTARQPVSATTDVARIRGLPVALNCPPIMKLSHIQAIVAVADAGSIRHSAQALGETQSALTKQVRQVEVETGLALFVCFPCIALWLVQVMT